MNFDVVTPSPTAAPAITTQPQPAWACRIGDTVSFSVTATGAAPLTYQWLHDGVAIDGWPSSPQYTTGLYPALDGTKYSVAVSNPYGSVTSASVTLSVLPPEPLAWGTPNPLGSSFAAGVDTPAVGSLDGYPIVLWNDGGTLRGAPGSGGTSAFTPIGTLAQPVRGRPKLLTGETTPVGCVVFVDDDGTGVCPAGSGNRLSAVALGTGDDGPFPLSDRFTLYPPPSSTGDCIASFTAAQGNASADVAHSFEVVFALVDAGTQQIRTGEAEATFHTTSPAGQPPQGSWTWTPADFLPPMLGADCDGPALLASDGMAKAGSSVLLAWAAGGNVCSARANAFSPASSSGVGAWSQGIAIFDRAAGAPVAGLDAADNALVVADRAPDPAGATPSYEVTAAFQPLSSTAWSLHVLDTPAAPSTITAAFDVTRKGYVAWMPSPASGPRAVYAAVYLPDTTTLSNGTWGPSQQISAASAVEVSEPRLCVSGAGTALALYAETDAAGAPLQVVGNRSLGGAWSLPGAIQTGTNEGRVPDCAARPYEAVWRETSPTDPTMFQIVEASAPEPGSGACAPPGSSGAACAQGTATVVDFPVPGGVADAIAAGPDGNIWFTGPSFVGRIDAQGTITEFPLSVVPLAIASGPGGNLWLTAFASGAKNKVLALTPQGTVASSFDVPGSSLGAIAPGPDGNVWYAANDASVHVLTPSTGATKALPLMYTPAAMVAGPDGNVWLTDSQGERIVSVSPAGATSVLMPPSTQPPGSWLGGITVGPDHNLWFTERASGHPQAPDWNGIGRLAPPSSIAELPACGSPLSITAGPDGNLWYTTASSKVGRITPAGQVTEFATHAVAVSTLWSIASASNGRYVWVLQEDDTIGRITVP
jgi:streptogramin lyase